MKTLPLLAALTLSACATTTPPENTGPTFEQKYAASQPVCYTDQQCDAMWDAAQLFVLKNSGMKIQISNDVVIQTFGSTSLRIAATVTMEPHVGDAKKLVYVAGCGNIFGCAVNPRDLMLRFNKEIGDLKWN